MVAKVKDKEIDSGKERADQVVEAFKASLNNDALFCITEAEFENLSLIVQDALASEKREIAESVEAIVRKLKSESKIPDISI
jgi:hypothetical protein